MTCDGIRESAHEYLKGWLEPREAQVVRQHLDRCPECSADLETTRTQLALLDTLPEIEPAPETWNRIQANLPRRTTRVFKFSLRMAAAASILVAVGSFILLATMPRSGALPVVAETHKALTWNEPFTAPAFTKIEIPDVGTLKLNKDATLRLLNPRSCV